MRRAILLLTFTLLFPFVVILAKEPEGAWLEERIKWISAPTEVNPRLQSAEADILYFGRDGQFGLVSCFVLRVPQEYMTISHGDPRGIYKGEWKAGDHTVSITYRLVEATIPIGEIPGPVQNGTINISSGSLLTFEGKQFRRAATLDQSTTEALYGIKPSSK